MAIVIREERRFLPSPEGRRVSTPDLYRTMWTSTLDLSPRRVLLTQLLGRFWQGAYFSSFAPLRVQNVPRQSLPSTSWMRVRNRLAGICGSDLHLIYADGDLRVAPAALPGHRSTYLGHEVVGEVIEIGDDVQRLRVGDRVVLQHGPNCLASGVQPLCRSCASGNYVLCERGILPGPQPIGGGWSEEMLLHEQQLFCIPQEMTDEQAVLLEPTAVALHSVLRHLPQAGDRVLIVGAGTIGLLTLHVLRALAPDAEISVLARYPFQIEKATRMGASHIIYPQDSYSEVQQVTNAQLYQGLLGNKMLLGGYDVIYDTIGSRNTLHDALRWARAKATIILVGLSLHMMHIDLTPIWYQEINLIGTMGQGMETWPIGTTGQRSTFSITTELITQGLLHPEQLITHHFALNNYRYALTTATDKRQNRAIKVLFDYSLLPASVVPNVRASARQRRPAAIDMTPPDPQGLTEQPAPSHSLQSTAYPAAPISTSPLMPVHILSTPPAVSAPEHQTSYPSSPLREDQVEILPTLPVVPSPSKPIETIEPAQEAHTEEQPEAAAIELVETDQDTRAEMTISRPGAVEPDELNEMNDESVRPDEPTNEFSESDELIYEPGESDELIYEPDITYAAYEELQDSQEAQEIQDLLAKDTEESATNASVDTLLNVETSKPVKSAREDAFRRRARRKGNEFSR